MKKITFSLLAFAAVAVLSMQQAAAFSLDVADQFAVLGQFSNNQTNFNNGTITGDIGMGNPRQFTASNASVHGNIRFSGAANVSGLSPDPGAGGGTGPFAVSGGGVVTGNVVANDAVVSSAINYVNNLSQTLGSQAGTSISVTSGGAINASAGTLDGGGNRIFTVSSVNFANGTFTITGGASDYVVLNVGSSAAFNGSIVLAGGITSDHVLINMFGGNYTTHTGGPTLTISTNGATTTGTFLDPNGGMQINHSELLGRFFGGDVVNQQIVSGADITAPQVVPDGGATATLFGLALASIEGVRRKLKRAKS
jgi:hypothetical protein